jgi:hypothetical protein
VDSMYCAGWMSARIKGVMEADAAEGHRRYLLQFVGAAGIMPPTPTPGSGADAAAYDQQVRRCAAQPRLVQPRRPPPAWQRASQPASPRQARAAAPAPPPPHTHTAGAAGLAPGVGAAAVAGQLPPPLPLA